MNPNLETKYNIHPNCQVSSSFISQPHPSSRRISFPSNKRYIQQLCLTRRVTRKRQPNKMITGTISKNPNLCITPTPHHFQSSKTQSFLCFSPNSPYPKSPNGFLSPREVLTSPKSCRLIPKATISDEFVVTESMADKSFYELLGIPESGSVVEIKQAYKQLARKYHPDVSPPDRTQEYTKKFILVQEAYETLSDPNRKALYDRDMARGLHLAFSARKGRDETMMEREEWKNQWQSQVSELKKKKMNKNSNNKSWAAQMREKRSSMAYSTESA